MIKSDPHGGGVFSLLRLHRIGVIKGTSAMATVHLIHRPLEAVAAELVGVIKKRGGMILSVFEAGANNADFGGIGYILGLTVPEVVQKSPKVYIILGGEAGALGLPAQFKAEFDLKEKVSGEIVHRAKTTAGFLEHTVQGGVCPGAIAQSWW